MISPKEIKKLVEDIERAFFVGGSSASDSIYEINQALFKDQFRGDTRREMFVRVFYDAINTVTCSPAIVLERKNGKGALVDTHGRTRPQDLNLLVSWECHVPLDKVGHRPAWALALRMVGMHAHDFPTELVHRILETGNALNDRHHEKIIDAVNS